MERSIERWNNMVPKVVAEGSNAQAVIALIDAQKDLNELHTALIRMTELAESRLLAVHKALEPEAFGVSGIESAEDAVAYMTGVLMPVLRQRASLDEAITEFYRDRQASGLGACNGLTR